MYPRQPMRTVDYVMSVLFRKLPFFTVKPIHCLRNIWDIYSENFYFYCTLLPRIMFATIIFFAHYTQKSPISLESVSINKSYAKTIQYLPFLQFFVYGTIHQIKDKNRKSKFEKKAYGLVNIEYRTIIVCDILIIYHYCRMPG